MAGSVVEERIENERFLAAFGGGRRRIGAVIGIEHARFTRLFGFGIRRCNRGCRRRTRRQVEAAFASAAAERERGRAQKDNGPSRRRRAVTAGHDKIPNAAGTIQRLPCSGESGTIMKLQRNSSAQPNFRCFSSRLSQAFPCAITFFGAVPP